MPSPSSHGSPDSFLEIFSNRDFLILCDLEEFRLLSTRQIQRLRFEQHISISSATRTTVRVLGRLEAHELIVRLKRRVGGAVRGSAANVWQLSSTGERVLRRLRGEPGRRRYIEPSPNFAAHTLAVADFAIDVYELARRASLDVLELETEPDCWRPFTGASGSREWLKPDLFAVVADAESESHSFIETDLASEHVPKILRKCDAYMRYYRAGVEQVGRGLFPAVVWVVPSEERATQLRSAIRGHPGLLPDLFHVHVPADALRVIAPEPTTNPPERRDP